MFIELKYDSFFFRRYVFYILQTTTSSEVIQ